MNYGLFVGFECLLTMLIVVACICKAIQNMWAILLTTCRQHLSQNLVSVRIYLSCCRVYSEGKEILVLF